MSASPVQRLAILQTSLIKALRPTTKNFPQEIDDEEYFASDLQKKKPILYEELENLRFSCKWYENITLKDCTHIFKKVNVCIRSVTICYAPGFRFSSNHPLGFFLVCF